MTPNNINSLINDKKFILKTIGKLLNLIEYEFNENYIDSMKILINHLDYMKISKDKINYSKHNEAMIISKTIYDLSINILDLYKNIDNKKNNILIDSYVNLNTKKLSNENENENKYKFKSFTNSNIEYVLNVDNHTCSCPSFEFNANKGIYKCKHTDKYIKKDNNNKINNLYKNELLQF